MSVKYLAKAKINLYLHLISQSANAYHQLESLVTFCKLYDEITFAKAKVSSIKIVGEFAHQVPNNQDNLIMKVILYFQKWDNNFNLEVNLTKNIPVGAGLGGGSADCAKTILACNTLLKLNLSINKMLEIATIFGADVPVCLKEQSAYIIKQGQEIIPTKLPIKPIYILLVNPKEKLLTADVFKNFKPPWQQIDNAYPTFATQQDLFTFLKVKSNSLTSSAMQLNPIISTILKALSMTNANLVRMTGSGATCFALYQDSHLLKESAKILQKKYPNFWIKESVLI